MVHILKNMKSLLPSFFKNLDDNFFLHPVRSQTESVLRISNMIHIVKSYGCYFILGRYFSEYELTETYEANTVICNVLLL